MSANDRARLGYVLRHTFNTTRMWWKFSFDPNLDVVGYSSIDSGWYNVNMAILSSGDYGIL